MNVVQINTYKSGGAALACLRLHEGLLDNGVHSNVLIRENSATDTQLKKRKPKLFEDILKAQFWNEQEISLNRFQMEAFTSPFSLYDLHQQPEVQDADIVHLHWVADFLNYGNFFSRKNIIWTLHDLNPFLGGIHYSVDEKRISERLLRYEKKIRNYKHRHIRGKGINFVFLSRWLFEEACEYAPWLIQEKCHFLKNPFPEDAYIPLSQKESRIKLGLPLDKKIILCVADYIQNYRKGVDILSDALTEDLVHQSNIYAISVGTADKMPIEKIRGIGRVNNNKELSAYYSSADLLVLPSRQDNLPNVMIEALMCGCPVVSFNTGGMRESIDETNGYLCAEMTSGSLKSGIEMVLNKRYDRNTIAKNAKNKFGESVVIPSYLKLYERVRSESKK